MNKQPAPKPGRANVPELVKADIDSRAEAGMAEYGTPLETHNGRDALWDAYDEILDLACYIRQELEERKDLEEQLAEARQLLDMYVEKFGIPY